MTPLGFRTWWPGSVGSIGCSPPAGPPQLRAEEANRGRTLADLLVVWELAGVRDWKTTLVRSQAAGFAFAATAWDIPMRNTAQGYAWGGLEQLVLARIKITPLGRAQGQQILQYSSGWRRRFPRSSPRH